MKHANVSSRSRRRLAGATATAAGLACALLAGVALAGAPVRISEFEADFPVVDEGGGNPRTMRLHQVRLENAYLRVDFLPELGGRLKAMFDKPADRDLFLVRPIEWPPTRYTAYGSQLGGHEVNFPCFHHGNNYMDQWHWHTGTEPDGTAVMTVGWTAPEHRQRVVVQWSLRPDEAILRSRTRFTNLNPRPMGFAPWSNMFFGYADDLLYVIPTAWVAPHGFNDSTLELWPWPWPEWEATSLCFWRNLPRRYNSVFAIGVEADFHGVYYEQSDYGMVRLFDRRELPGIKMYAVPPSPDRTPGPTDYTEIWTSPVLSHEDVLWWEAFGVRTYDEAFFGVHGTGGYRAANANGALNLIRHSDTVEAALRVTRTLTNAVITLSSIDGDWLRERVDLTPGQPWRRTLERPAGRLPLDVHVYDGNGRLVLHLADHPDPAPRPEIRFAGEPRWRATPYHAALKAELYQPLWRGPTGGYGGFGEPGARAFRALLEQEPDNPDYARGLARSLINDVQLRQPGQPRVGTPEETAARATNSLVEAATVLAPLIDQDARAALLLADIRLRQGDREAAHRHYTTARHMPAAQVGLADLAAVNGDFASAAEHSASALRAFPGHTAIMQRHAANLIRTDAPDAARALLLACADLDPVDPITFHLLAWTDPGQAPRWIAQRDRLHHQTDPPQPLEARLHTLGWADQAADPPPAADAPPDGR